MNNIEKTENIPIRLEFSPNKVSLPSSISVPIPNRNNIADNNMARFRDNNTLYSIRGLLFIILVTIQKKTIFWRILNSK